MQLFLEIILIKKFHADCAALKAPPCGSYLRIVTKENPKQRAACIMHPVVMLNSGQRFNYQRKIFYTSKISWKIKVLIGYNLKLEFVKTVKQFFNKNFYQQITFIPR